MNEYLVISIGQSDAIGSGRPAQNGRHCVDVDDDVGHSPQFHLFLGHFFTVPGQGRLCGHLKAQYNLLQLVS